MWKILLMEEILHHLECINLVDSGIHTYQLVQDFFHQQYEMYESGFCPINTFFVNGRDSGFWSEPEKVFLLQILYTPENLTWFNKKSPNCKGTSSSIHLPFFRNPAVHFSGCTTIGLRGTGTLPWGWIFHPASHTMHDVPRPPPTSEWRKLLGWLQLLGGSGPRSGSKSWFVSPLPLPLGRTPWLINGNYYSNYFLSGMILQKLGASIAKWWIYVKSAHLDSAWR